MPEIPESSIELLPKTTFEEYPLGKKLVTWMANIGRVVIIFTELLAFAVFVSRLKLDRELTDLTDAIENKMVIVQNAQSLERDVKDLQSRLGVIKDLRRQQIPTAKVFSLLADALPTEVTLTGLTYEADQLFLMAGTPSAESFAQLIKNIREEVLVSEIQLTAGRFSAEDARYDFSLALTVDTKSLR